MAVLAVVLFGLFCLVTVRDIRFRLVYGEDLALLASVRVLAAACSLFPDVTALEPVRWGFPTLGESVVAGLVASFLLWALGWLASKLSGKSALGVGDVLLLGVCCLFVGLRNLEAYLLMVALTGIALSLFWLLARKSKTFPFAPAIVWPCWLLLFPEGWLLR